MDQKAKQKAKKKTTTTTTTTRRMFYGGLNEEDDDDIDDEDENPYADEQVFEGRYTASVLDKKYTIGTTMHSRVTPFISDENQPLNYCSFFNNRAPSPQINLKNCTWYKENSCCLQSEIESTFSKVRAELLSSLFRTFRLYTALFPLKRSNR